MIKYVNLPLFDNPSYSYRISLEEISYKFKFYFNTRDNRWMFDLSYADGEPIVLGEALVPNYPILLDYNIENLSGYMYLQPIGENQNETITNPYELNQYYTLRYYYDDGE